MKIKEFLKYNGDIDVYDNVCEELGIAFWGPMKLTKEGKQKFAEVLEYDIEIKEGGLYGFDKAIVDVDYPDWEDRLKKAKELFYSLAGYCPADDYDKWFIEL